MMADEVKIRWRLPVITLILLATAVPVELRPLGSEPVDFSIGFWDVLANVVAYFPVGIALGKSGGARAILAAALMSTFAESSQFIMMHRAPSAIDVGTNVLGATLGVVISQRWGIFPTALIINRRRALAAGGLALLLLLGVWARSGPVPNSRGATTPGTLEAHWRFDESSGRSVIDSSSHGVNGEFRNQPKRVAGRMGGAVQLDGKKDCIEFGRSTALRLVGSMTISAWIRSSSFPADDAAILSSLRSTGCQLDTTIDRGPRTIGFKLTDAGGELMARYGATPLALDTWFHVAGVYDAEAKTLDVYLNGELDNGFLLGAVSGYQRSSRGPVYVGRRSNLPGYEFAGSIDDVRIYSVALAKPLIGEVMRGAEIDVSALSRLSGGETRSLAQAGLGSAMQGDGLVFSDPEDANFPAASGLLGALAALACIGLWRPARVWRCVVVCVSVGLVLLAVAPAHLPSFNLWLIPLTSLAGGASVAISFTRQNPASAFSCPPGVTQSRAPEG